MNTSLIDRREKWHRRMIEEAYLKASWSKDPSTKCGAVIVDDTNVIVSSGYNGFPKAIQDTVEKYEDRELKNRMVIHAEMNALLFARTPVKGCTLYVVPMPPCNRCAVMIIQAGISKVVTVKPTPMLLDRWGDAIKLTEEMFREAGVNLRYLD